MNINISCPTGITSDTRVTTDNGELHNLAHMVLTFEPDKEVVALLTFLLPRLDSLNRVRATVSEQHLRELADAHDFDLVKRDQIDGRA